MRQNIDLDLRVFRFFYVCWLYIAFYVFLEKTKKTTYYDFLPRFYDYFENYIITSRRDKLKSIP